MPLTIELIGDDITASMHWKSFSYTEQIGQPDELNCEVDGFMGDDPGITETARDLLANLNSFFSVVVRLDADILFTGLLRTIGLRKPTKGVVTYGLQASSWHFLLSRCLVGVPNGGMWLIEGEYDADNLPTPINVDARADSVTHPNSLFRNYWASVGCDLDSYSDLTVTAADSEGMGIDFSGTDMEGAINELAAAASASCMWWLANDGNNVNLNAPGLALHWGIVVLPDEGDDGDDLGAGLPSADEPTVLAPYDIDNDNPDWVTSIMSTASSFSIDHTPRADAAYVRGATGFILDVLPAPPGWPVPYQIGEEHVGGTGWVGVPGGLWGSEYVDAPGAISEEQRDAYGQAFLASRSTAQFNGTITVVGYDGWHKGQAIRVRDEDYGFDGRWFLIRGVTMKQNDPFALANEYTLILGEALPPALGYALREQRLREQRKPIEPATQFIPYMTDLYPAPGETLKAIMQLASDSGKARNVGGVTARWHMLINGEDVEDPEDDGNLFWITDAVTVTNDQGQITATVHASESATAEDAAEVHAWVVL